MILLVSTMALMAVSDRSAVPTPKPPAHPAKPVIGLPTLFTADDYPIDAIAALEQGTTAVTLEIGASGAIEKCTVTASASPSLDARACKVITERASYTAARDRQGRAVASSDTARIRWVLPDPPMDRFSSGYRQVMAYVPAEGPYRCLATSTFAGFRLPERGCDILVNDNIRFKPAALPRPFVITFREDQIVGATIAAPPTGAGAARVIMRQHVDSAGTITSCERVAEPLPNIDSSPPIACRINSHYAPLATEPARDRVMTVTWSRSFTPTPATDH